MLKTAGKIYAELAFRLGLSFKYFSLNKVSPACRIDQKETLKPIQTRLLSSLPIWSKPTDSFQINKKITRHKTNHYI